MTSDGRTSRAVPLVKDRGREKGFAPAVGLAGVRRKVLDVAEDDGLLGIVEDDGSVDGDACVAPLELARVVEPALRER